MGQNAIFCCTLTVLFAGAVAESRKFLERFRKSNAVLCIIDQFKLNNWVDGSSGLISICAGVYIEGTGWLTGTPT